MRKLIIALIALAGCRTTTTTTMTTTPGGAGAAHQTGAIDAVSAVRGFMAAAKQTDLQSMSLYWGDREGATAGRLPRQELEQRELVMMRCLRHDSYEIAGDAPAVGGARAIVLNLTYGGLSRSTDLHVVRGPADRWYVNDVSLPKLQDICMHRG